MMFEDREEPVAQAPAANAPAQAPPDLHDLHMPTFDMPKRGMVASFCRNFVILVVSSVVVGTLVLFFLHLLIQYIDPDNRNAKTYDHALLMSTQPAACTNHIIDEAKCILYEKWMSQSWTITLIGLAITDTMDDWKSLFHFFFRWCDPTDEICKMNARTFSTSMYGNFAMYLYLIFGMIFVSIMTTCIYQCRRHHPKELDPNIHAQALQIQNFQQFQHQLQLQQMQHQLQLQQVQQFQLPPGQGGQGPPAPMAQLMAPNQFFNPYYAFQLPAPLPPLPQLHRRPNQLRIEDVSRPRHPQGQEREREALLKESESDE